MAPAWLIGALLVLAPASLLQGQQAAPRFARWEAPAGVPSDTVPVGHGDYRYEGLAFGGLVFGALGAWIGTRDFGGICPLEPGATCGDDGNKVGRAVALGLVGATVGGGVGYLVGRFSPSAPGRNCCPPPRSRSRACPTVCESGPAINTGGAPPLDWPSEAGWAP